MDGKLENLLETVVKAIDPEAELLGHETLTGGVSAQVTAFEAGRPGGAAHKFVLRQYGARDVAANPQLAEQEFRLLRLLQKSAVFAPSPVLFIQDATVLPSPAIVVDFMEGSTDTGGMDTDEVVSRMGWQLADIHDVDGNTGFLPEREEQVTAQLANTPEVYDDALSERRIRDALSSVWPLRHRNRPVLLHGDFWPGNIVWRDGDIVGVIDWEDAATGDPMADLATARMEAAWHMGFEAMEMLTEIYLTLCGDLDYSDLAAWDLVSALRPAGLMSEWGLPDDAVKSMRATHKTFVEQACAALEKA